MWALICSGCVRMSKPATRAAAAAGREDAAEHADRRRFARPVGTQEAEDFAAADLEADPVDGHEAAEPLLQVPDDDGFAGRRRAEGGGRKDGGRMKAEG